MKKNKELNKKLLTNIEFDYIRKKYKERSAGFGYGLKRKGKYEI